MELPGSDFARDNGYTLSYHATDGSSAVYSKSGIHLDVKCKESRRLEAGLSFVHRFLCVTTLTFSLPNKNFKVFEEQIESAHVKLVEEIK